MRNPRIQKRLRDETGAATVELAISMLVLVPVLLYGLYIQDVLMARLDLQEAVSAAAWDHATHFRSDVQNDVAGDNNETWSNHTSLGDRGGPPALGAERTNPININCRRSANVGRPMNMVSRSFFDQYNEGGHFECSADLTLANLIIPQGFMDRRSNQDMLPDGAAWNLRLQEYSFGIVADTWAMDVSEEYMPGETSGDLCSRVNNIYLNPVFAEYHLAEAEFFMEGFNQEVFLLLPELGAGVKLNMNVAKRHRNRPVDRWHVTPYRDNSGDIYQHTYNARGSHYMGKRNAPAR